MVTEVHLLPNEMWHVIKKNEISIKWKIKISKREDVRRTRKKKRITVRLQRERVSENAGQKIIIKINESI